MTPPATDADGEDGGGGGIITDRAHAVPPRAAGMPSDPRNGKKERKKESRGLDSVRNLPSTEK